MISRLSAFAVWALAGFAAVYWMLRLLGGGPDAPGAFLAQAPAVSAGVDWSRMLGKADVAVAELAPPAASRFKLLGVMASSPDGAAAGQGVVLLGVDDKPARAFASGAVVDAPWRVLSIGPREVVLGGGEGQGQVRLPVVGLPPVAPGALPPPPAGIEPAAPPPPPTVGLITPALPPAMQEAQAADHAAQMGVGGRGRR
jgi:general secretion pathway protein C